MIAGETGVFRFLVLAATRGRRAAPTRWPLLGEGVAKHKCGSCHFFQEAGLAGSGWCHHPQRKVSSDVLIMVRRNELACRDEWSRSLWQPREGPRSNGDMPFQRPATGPLPPALAENLRSVLNHDLALAASAQGEDVLLSEARIVSETHESWEPPQRPFAVGNFDPRTAIFRAREAYREKVRAKAAAERQSAGVEAVVQLSVAEDAPPASAEEPTTELSDRGSTDAGAATALNLEDVADEQPRLDTDARPGMPVEGEAHVAAPAPLATGGVNEERLSGIPLLIAGDSPHADAEAEWHASAAPEEQLRTPELTTPDIDEYRFPSRLAHAEENETLPDWYRADLPRICRTCRDYRPSADGQRGWCANSWAFTHRRLVLEDDPAPCQSAIGDWWLPVDDVWLVAADVSSHGRATPLLDRLVAKAEQQRRRS